MADVPKKDDLVALLAAQKAEQERQAATIRRYLQANDTAVDTSDFTNSVSYVDLGPTVGTGTSPADPPVKPGPSGRLRITIDVRSDFISPGEGVAVSWRISGGPTVVAADDKWSWTLFNGAGNADVIAASSSRMTLSPVLERGGYQVTATIRSISGGVVGVTGRSLFVEPA